MVLFCKKNFLYLPLSVGIYPTFSLSLYCSVVVLSGSLLPQIFQH